MIVLNVHCAGSEPLVGTKLFDSMQQNGLLYGEMDIFHRPLTFLVQEKCCLVLLT